MRRNINHSVSRLPSLWTLVSHCPLPKLSRWVHGPLSIQGEINKWPEEWGTTGGGGGDDNKKRFKLRSRMRSQETNHQGEWITRHRGALVFKVCRENTNTRGDFSVFGWWSHHLLQRPRVRLRRQDAASQEATNQPLLHWCLFFFLHKDKYLSKNSLSRTRWNTGSKRGRRPSPRGAEEHGNMNAETQVPSRRRKVDAQDEL